MRTDLHIESIPTTSRTVVKLAILGGLVLGCVYMVLVLFSNAVKILE